MASKSKSSSASRSSKLLGEKSEKQIAFEREAREKLENADMKAFDKMMKRVVRASIVPEKKA